MFNMGAAKISQILTGKREPDVLFLKAVQKCVNDLNVSVGGLALFPPKDP
jgi:hypothetical protein